MRSKSLGLTLWVWPMRSKIRPPCVSHSFTPTLSIATLYSLVHLHCQNLHLADILPKKLNSKTHQMIPEKKIANAVSGKTARACDCCVKKRARWYCPADDAFLCQVCDGSVHSANLLAKRHERVLLKTASFKRVDLPTWNRGSIRKARTPRRRGPNPAREVPEMGAEDTTSSLDGEGEDQEQLLYRVPVFDPFHVGEITCESSNNNNNNNTTSFGFDLGVELEGLGLVKAGTPQDAYLPLDLDLEEFAADVETLLGKGFDEESYAIEQLGLLECNNNNNNVSNHNHDNNNNSDGNYYDSMDLGKLVKEEENNELGISTSVGAGEGEDMTFREPFELSFDYDDDNFPTTCQDGKVELEDSPVVGDHEVCKLDGDDDEIIGVKRTKILLRLDYEAISDAWASQGSSPWMNGHRPDINPDDCWPHCMGTCGIESHHPFYVDHRQLGGMGGHGAITNVGREARVSRYREKRRTRLFAKKIRYEVRKLNAEKRPRMKGRFVKRSSFAPTTNAFPLRSK